MEGSTVDEREGVLRWPKLIEGSLVKRYKRFMADVRLKNGQVRTAHCPNSGSMLGCSEPGRRVYLSHHDNPGRRLKYTWELIQMPSSLVGVNTNVPNRLAKISIQAGKIARLRRFDRVRAEVRYGQNSRIDLLLEKDKKRCFVEVKNCTLVEDGIAYFPDAVTSRGLKHLIELQNEVRSGNRAVMFFLVQREDASLFRPADHIDAVDGEELRRAERNGVEILVYDVKVDLNAIRINRPLRWEL
jgi:sugar fermentation stimulation protein A